MRLTYDMILQDEEDAWEGFWYVMIDATDDDPDGSFLWFRLTPSEYEHLQDGGAIEV